MTAKPTTPQDMIDAYLAKGKSIHMIPSRSSPPKDLCYRSGNHIKYRARQDLKKDLARRKEA